MWRGSFVELRVVRLLLVSCSLENISIPARSASLDDYSIVVTYVTTHEIYRNNTNDGINNSSLIPEQMEVDILILDLRLFPI